MGRRCAYGIDFKFLLFIKDYKWEIMRRRERELLCCWYCYMFMLLAIAFGFAVAIVLPGQLAYYYYYSIFLFLIVARSFPFQICLTLFWNTLIHIFLGRSLPVLSKYKLAM